MSAISDTLVIHALADSEASLIERIASLEADIVSRDELICAAFDRLAALNAQVRKQKSVIASQREELRQLFRLDTASSSEAA